MEKDFSSKTDLELMVGQDEKILWRGKPNKRGYVLEGVFNPMLPFALVWFIFDSIFIFGGIMASKESPAVGLGMLAFMLIHMMPVWIYLAGVIFIGRKYKHTEYIITDKAIYVSGGLFSYTCQMKPFAEFSRVNIRRGIIDQILGVGDVVISTNETITSNKGITGNVEIAIEDIHAYKRIFSMIKELQTDVYTDTMYPNDLRPATNHGYNTQYEGKGLDI